MSGTVSVPNVFGAATSGTTPQLDANFTAVVAALNNPITYAIYSTDSGAVNAYVATLVPPPANQAALLGVDIAFKATTPNTGASTLNVNAQGAQAIVRPGGAPVQAGDIAGTVCVIWDGTNYVLQSGSIANTLGPKNRLINGGSEIWQRGTTVAVAASSNGYGPDRFTLTTGANEAFTVAQVAGLTTPSQWAAKVQRNAAQTGTTALIFEQPFELNNIFPLRGQIVTVSFTAKAGANWSPASGTLSFIVATGTGAAARRGSTPYTGEATPISSSANLTTTPTRYSATSTAIAATTTQLTLYFTWTPVGTAGADDSFTIDDVQLEIGGVATAFELADFEVETAKCQRYFGKSFLQTTAPAQSAGVGTGEVNWNASTAGTSSLNSSPRILFPVTMRTSPSITLFNPAAANAQVRDESASADCSTSSGAQATDSGFRVQTTGAAGTAVGNILAVHYTASAEL